MSEIFELHITGDEKIHEAAKQIGVRTISIDLLTPQGSVLRTEHMTSHVLKCSSFLSALDVIGNWKFFLRAQDVRIIRTKIECPPYSHYIDQSIYMETHFKDDSFQWPTSRSKHKNTLTGTSRIYGKNNYETFMMVHEFLGKNDFELCLHDSFVEEDKDWFSLWE